MPSSWERRLRRAEIESFQPHSAAQPDGVPPTSMGTITHMLHAALNAGQFSPYALSAALKSPRAAAASLKSARQSIYANFRGRAHCTGRHDRAHATRSRKVPMSESSAKSPADAAAARRRRRWLTFGETIGVLALLISAASFWDSHKERTQAEAEKSVKPATPSLLLTSTPADDGERLKLAPANGAIVIQTQTVTFPEALDVSAVDTTGDARIDAGWFADGLRNFAKASGDKVFSGRLPVGIVTRYEVNGETVTDTALYDLGYTLHPRMLRSDKVELEGLRLVSRKLGDGLQAKLDARWKAGNPAS
jgi:hypothetical protein